MTVEQFGTVTLSWLTAFPKFILLFGEANVSEFDPKKIAAQSDFFSVNLKKLSIVKRFVKSSGHDNN